MVNRVIQTLKLNLLPLGDNMLRVLIFLINWYLRFFIIYFQQNELVQLIWYACSKILIIIVPPLLQTTCGTRKILLGCTSDGISHFETCEQHIFGSDITATSGFMSFKDSFSYFCNCFNDVLLHTLLVTKVRGMIFVLLVFPRRKSVLQSKFTRSQVKYESLCVFGKNDSQVGSPPLAGTARHLAGFCISSGTLQSHLCFTSVTLVIHQFLSHSFVFNLWVTWPAKCPVNAS